MTVYCWIVRIGLRFKYACSSVLQLSVTSVLEFWGHGSTGSIFLLKSQFFKIFLEWSFADFWIGCQEMGIIFKRQGVLKTKLTKKMPIPRRVFLSHFSMTCLKVGGKSNQKKCLAITDLWAKIYSQLTLFLKTPLLSIHYSLHISKSIPCSLRRHITFESRN